MSASSLIHTCTKDLTQTGRYQLKLSQFIGYIQHTLKNPAPNAGYQGFNASVESIRKELFIRYNDKKSHAFPFRLQLPLRVRLLHSR